MCEGLQVVKRDTDIGVGVFLQHSPVSFHPSSLGEFGPIRRVRTDGYSRGSPAPIIHQFVRARGPVLTGPGAVDHHQTLVAGPGEETPEHDGNGERVGPIAASATEHLHRITAAMTASVA